MKQQEICLQHNGECVCHHLNGPQRVHNLLHLVLSQNPVWCKPGRQTGRQSAAGGATPAPYKSCSNTNTDVLWYRTGSTRRCLNKEASIDWCIHLLLDKTSFGVFLMFACGEAVNAANPLHHLGQVHDLLKWKAKLAWRDVLELAKEPEHLSQACAQYRPQRGAGLAAAERVASRPWWRCCRPFRLLYRQPSLGISAADPATFPPSFLLSTRPQWSCGTIERNQKRESRSQKPLKLQKQESHFTFWGFLCLKTTQTVKIRCTDLTGCVDFVRAQFLFCNMKFWGQIADKGTESLTGQFTPTQSNSPVCSISTNANIWSLIWL